jgi:hypothetical protein
MITIGVPARNLRLAVRALSEFVGRLLESSKGHPAPLCQKAQVRVSVQRSQMTDLAQKVAHAGEVLQIPASQI